MSTDTDRVVNFAPSFHQFWSLPFQIAVSLYLLHQQVNLSFIRLIFLVLVLKALINQFFWYLTLISLPLACLTIVLGCVPLGWSGSGSKIQNHSDHDALKGKTVNPYLQWIHRFLWSTMIQVLLYHWSWSGSSQRNAPLIVVDHCDALTLLWSHVYCY